MTTESVVSTNKHLDRAWGGLLTPSLTSDARPKNTWPTCRQPGH